VNTVDVAVVGAGVAGLALAAALRGAGLRILVADARPVRGDRPVAPPGPARVSAVNPASRRLFDALGAWAGVPADRVGTFRVMRVWDGEGNAAVGFGSAEGPALGHIVENRALCRALEGVIDGAEGLELRLGCALRHLRQSGGQWILGFAGGEELAAGLVVGADGADSQVRRLAGLGTRSWSYRQRALTATARLDTPHDETAWQCFTAEGPLALLPLHDPHEVSIVWSLPPDRAGELAAMPSADFCAELGRATEQRAGCVRECGPRASVDLRQHHAVRYVRERLALIGDAAHGIHPMAGQGGNLGLADARVLAEELKAAGEPGALDLRRYERRRMPANLAMMGLMETLRFLYGRQDPLWVWLRNTGMAGLDRSALFKRLVVDYAAGDWT
jgi:2-octaprenylphenol hydroxylase